MTYYLSFSNPYDIDLGCSVFDDFRKTPLFGMEYLDSSDLDWRARDRRVQMLNGFPVKPETAPKKLFWNGGKRALPDVMGLAQVMIVGQRFRDLVEIFEPGLHQFIAVDVFKEKKDAPSARYYWFNICQRLDSVDSVRTTFLIMPSHEGTKYWTDMKSSNGDYVQQEGLKLVFSRSKIGNHHIWHDPTILAGGHGLCSSAFGEAAIAGSFLGLNVTKRDEA